jgi:hypothetical protein
MIRTKVPRIAPTTKIGAAVGAVGFADRVKSDLLKVACLLVKNVGNWTVIPMIRPGGVCRYTRFMYNISRSNTGGVVLKCKACSHSERVNEFDDRQGSRRTQAARAMLNHSRIEHGREPVGNPMPKALESWV